MANYVALAYFALIPATVAQLFFKVGAGKFLGARLFLNIYMCSAIALMLLSIMMNIVALRHIPLKYLAFIQPTSFLLVPLLARLFLKEELPGRFWYGTVLVILGVGIFNYQ